MFGWLKSNKKQVIEAQTSTVQSNIIKQPVEKTQAEKDVELMASDEWLNQLTEAKDTWNTKFDELKKVITDMQETQNYVSFSTCSEFFDVRPLDGESIFEPAFKNRLIKKIEEITSLEKYCADMTERTTKYYSTYVRPINYYVSEFVILRNSFLDGALNVFNNFWNNFEIILADHYELNRVYVNINPGASNEGRLEWLKHMHKYATTKLIGVSSMNFYPKNNPLYNPRYFGYSGWQTHEAVRFHAMLIFAAVEYFKKSGEPSTTVVGIEFENSLRDALIDEISDVVVESTPVTGDHGADLLIRVGSVRIAIQAKRYTGVVGNAAVQEIFAAKQFYDADFAMVVTTSRFTNPAKVLAEKLEVTLATESDFIQKIRRLLD